LIIRTCESSILLIERYAQTYQLKQYSSILLAALYWSSITLVPYLSDSRVHDVFTTNCILLRCTTADFALAGVILQGILALAWMLKVQIPESAEPQFEGMGAKEALRDVPVAFALPRYHEISNAICGGMPRSQNPSRQLGTLLSR
jgi:hypothetical protein